MFDIPCTVIKLPPLFQTRWLWFRPGFSGVETSDDMPCHSSRCSAAKAPPEALDFAVNKFHHPKLFQSISSLYKAKKQMMIASGRCRALIFQENFWCLQTSCFHLQDDYDARPKKKRVDSDPGYGYFQLELSLVLSPAGVEFDVFLQRSKIRLWKSMKDWMGGVFFVARVVNHQNVGDSLRFWIWEATRSACKFSVIDGRW